jgi:hypothetical protein
MAFVPEDRGAGCELAPSFRDARASTQARNDGTSDDYGVVIPIAFSAASIRSGGPIFTASG